MQRSVKFALLLLVVCSMAGCGFHLKGHSPASQSLQSASVTFEQPFRVGDPPLIMALENRLRTQGKLAKSAALTRIHVSDIQNKANVLSVSPIDGRTSAVELTATVNFNVTEQGQALISAQTLSVRRAYSFDNTERLAAEAEQADLIANMQSELADLILLRTETALARAQSARNQSAIEAK